MLFKEDAYYYARGIKNGDYTPSQLVEYALDNISDLNPKLNAITLVQADSARKLAQEYDQKLNGLTDQEKAQLPPYFGVPILIKDMGQNQAGVTSTSGAELLKDNVASTSDNFVQAIIDAGFIIVGRTNVPEFGFKGISDSRYFGPVNSPVDLNRNAGGSSGGAGAALKAGIVPVVTASDGGGSIRIPASFNGLIGLKPSRGRIVVGPNRYRGWQGASTDFFLTKSVRDTWELLKITQAEQLGSPFPLAEISEDDLTDLQSPLKIAYSYKSMSDDLLGTKASQDVYDYLNQAKDKLANLGHQFEEITQLPLDNGEELLESYYLVNCGETAATMKNLEKSLNRPIKPSEVEPLTWAIYQEGLDIKAYEYSQLLSIWDKAGAQADEFFANEADVFMMPVSIGPAPLQGQFDECKETDQEKLKAHKLTREEKRDLVRRDFSIMGAYSPYSYPVNLLGLCAISLPIGKTKEGLPYGIQFVSRKGSDYLLLQLAKQVEEAGLIDTEIIEL